MNCTQQLDKTNRKGAVFMVNREKELHKQTHYRDCKIKYLMSIDNCVRKLMNK